MWREEELDIWFNGASMIIGMGIGFIMLGVHVHNFYLAGEGILSILSMGYVVTKSLALLGKF